MRGAGSCEGKGDNRCDSALAGQMAAAGPVSSDPIRRLEVAGWPWLATLIVDCGPEPADRRAIPGLQAMH